MPSSHPLRGKRGMGRVTTSAPLVWTRELVLGAYEGWRIDTAEDSSFYVNTMRVRMTFVGDNAPVIYFNADKQILAFDFDTAAQRLLDRAVETLNADGIPVPAHASYSVPFDPCIRNA